MHLAHTRSLFIGRYDPQPMREQVSGAARGNPRAEAEAVADVRRGPRQQDIDAARQMLGRLGLPEHLRRAAQATLSRAGLTT